jgi:hypothetical protein
VVFVDELAKLRVGVDVVCRVYESLNPPVLLSSQLADLSEVPCGGFKPMMSIQDVQAVNFLEFLEEGAGRADPPEPVLTIIDS